MSGMTTQTNIDSSHFINDSLQLALELVNDLLVQINEIDLLTNHNNHFSNMNLTKISLNLTQFVELTTLTSKLISLKKNIVLDEVKKSHIHLLFILKGINQSQLKGDSIVLEDLIKYELKDNLTQWKINIIPKIKKSINP